MKYTVSLSLGIMAIVGVALLATSARAEPIEDSIQCHIDNIFYEGNSESLLGQTLIAQTVKNRTANPKRWGKTDCETIYQPSQFSWTLLSAKQLHDFKEAEIAGYMAIKENIGKILSAGPVPGFEGVNHYLRCDSRDGTRWEDDMEFLGQVGAHCFYKD